MPTSTSAMSVLTTAMSTRLATTQKGVSFALAMPDSVVTESLVAILTNVLSEATTAISKPPVPTMSAAFLALATTIKNPYIMDICELLILLVNCNSARKPKFH